MSDGPLFSREFLERIKPDIHEGIRIMEKMKNQEINEKVAKRLGWKRGIVARNINGNVEGWITPKGRPSYADIPSYCTDISAAWEIVEKIRRTELFSLCWHDGQWHCEINCMDGIREIDEESDTAPMAICLAFLKLDQKK